MNWAEYLWHNYMKVPQRVVLCLFGFMAIVNAYTMRLCLDRALTYMVSHRLGGTTDSAQNSTLTNDTKFKRLHSLRQRLNSLNATKSLIPDRSAVSLQLDVQQSTYEWSESLQTMILTSFYVGYVISHVPGGQLAQRYGGKWVLAVGVVSAAILTLLTPVAIKVGGPVALILIRLLIGLSEGPIFPAVCTLLAHWVPAKERGKLGVLVLSGGQLGTFLANFMSTFLMLRFRWYMLFYFFGGCALLWFVCFIMLCYNDPESNPFIQVQEKQYLETEIGSIHNEVELAPTPWKDIFKSAPVWALISASVQYDWTQLQTRPPTMQLDAREQALSGSVHSSASAIATATAALPNILNWFVSLLSGALSDYLVNHNILSTTVTRKIMTAIAAVGPNFIMSLRSCFTCCERKDVAALFNCALAVMGTYYAGIKLTPLDMSPNYAGTLMGIANGLGSLTALVAPYLEDNALKYVFKPPFNELRALFWLACTMLLTGEVQEFNDPLSAANKNK